jgi:hypothetical protein
MIRHQPLDSRALLFPEATMSEAQRLALFLTSGGLEPDHISELSWARNTMHAELCHCFLQCFRLARCDLIGPLPYMHTKLRIAGLRRGSQAPVRGDRQR